MIAQPLLSKHYMKFGLSDIVVQLALNGFKGKRFDCDHKSTTQATPEVEIFLFGVEPRTGYVVESNAGKQSVEGLKPRNAQSWLIQTEERPTGIISDLKLRSALTGRLERA